MERDIRGTALYREVESFYDVVRRPGTGQISDASELHASPDGMHAAFAGTIVEKLEGALPTRICQIDLASGQTRVLTFGPNNDRSPKYSPDGRLIAFLSDRGKSGDFQLYLLDPVSGALWETSPVDGWVEYLHWSPDGRRILLGVAGHGADVSGGQGAITSEQTADAVPSWAPSVQSGDQSYRWRRAWIYEVASERVREISDAHTNIWEGVWCGNDALAAIVSPGPGEGFWYTARLEILPIEDKSDRRVAYAPRDQLGWLSASPSGETLAVVEAICSDRWIVAGNLQLIDCGTLTIRRVDTHGVDVTYTEWRSARHLLVAGHREFDTVVGWCDAVSGTFVEVWSSREVSAGSRYIAVSGFNEVGDCVLVGESFTRAPEIATIRAGQYCSIKSLDLGYASQTKAITEVKCVSWTTPDGLPMQGWLLLPQGDVPHPLIMNIHGGPVWQWHPMWLGRSRYVPLCMLACRGYAIFLPNPRGSSGRGQEFARLVVGEMGGADTHDYLSGIDHLVNQRIADPTRLGVTGVSYGGFMSSWLITQDNRFVAAVPVAPVTNQVTAHLISNIPEFVKLFIGETYTDPDGKYFRYSPIMHAHKARTPTLLICGALDRCTPPEEALQFHHALLENGVTSVLITYPEEGHGIHKLPAAIDYAARMLTWFEELMSADADKPSMGTA